MSTYETRTRFINDAQLEIENNFDPLRTQEDRVLVDLETLLSVCGEIFVPAREQFASVAKGKHFVKMHVRMNMRLERRHASCRVT